MRLKGKTAIITGGGGEIGRTTALRFSEEGAQIVVAGINKEDGMKTIDLINKNQAQDIFIQTDMTKEKDVEYLVEKTLAHFGKLDILYNNAGVNSDEKKIPDVTMEEWQKVIDINMTGTFLGMKHAIPQMEPGSAIINTASIAGIKGQKLVSAYSATEFGRQNIRVNAIAPGVIDTKMVDGWRQTEKWPILSTANVLRRVGEPEEVANTVLFLGSDEASFITGETIVIDGGTLNI